MCCCPVTTMSSGAGGTRSGCTALWCGGPTYSGRRRSAPKTGGCWGDLASAARKGHGLNRGKLLGYNAAAGVFGGTAVEGGGGQADGRGAGATQEGGAWVLNRRHGAG